MPTAMNRTKLFGGAPAERVPTPKKAGMSTPSSSPFSSSAKRGSITPKRIFGGSPALRIRTPTKGAEGVDTAISGMGAKRARPSSPPLSASASPSSADASLIDEDVYETIASAVDESVMMHRLASTPSKEARYWIGQARKHEREGRHAEVLNTFEAAMSNGARPAADLHKALQEYLSRKSAAAVREDGNSGIVTPSMETPARRRIADVLDQSAADVAKELLSPIDHGFESDNASACEAEDDQELRHEVESEESDEGEEGEELPSTPARRVRVGNSKRGATGKGSRQAALKAQLGVSHSNGEEKREGAYKMYLAKVKLSRKQQEELGATHGVTVVQRSARIQRMMEKKEGERAGRGQAGKKGGNDILPQLQLEIGDEGIDYSVLNKVLRDVDHVFVPNKSMGNIDLSPLKRRNGEVKREEKGGKGEVAAEVIEKAYQTEMLKKKRRVTCEIK
uniref:Uncharacterized protein n=1 Tax=Palpitomonas bilix TaxID=652834 RepID=A0A7S3GM78_9EUKA|mmetsp:Transcript_9479/g.25721  ORF Transcript_9479/g.25721 Transcript_9479/m.25721 type:complete len:451 (+) Transcript_9479:56-1408(+)